MRKVRQVITFLYYRDIDKATEFYRNIMGFELAVDQGWAKIFKAAENAYVGVVDEKHGYHRVSSTKPVMLTFVVPDVDEWFRYVQRKGLHILTQPRDNDELGIRMFLLEDPEGYVVEIQKFKQASRLKQENQGKGHSIDFR